jgi:hypothetical protein
MKKMTKIPINKLLNNINLRDRNLNSVQKQFTLHYG